jgi:hypothetical protein
MRCNLPEPAQVHKAIDIYLAHAYPTAPPLTTRSLLNLLKTWAGDFYASPAFARTGEPACPRLTVRLGNSAYPHMKLALEPAPSGDTYLFKADSHDKHLCPAEQSPDYAAFMDLRERNQKIVEKIEQAWADAGVPTFKTYLQADLARREKR